MRQQPPFIAHLVACVRRLFDPTPEDCLRRLQRMEPQYIAQIDTVQWAQRCLRQAERVVGRRVRLGVVSPGDAQAIGAYENALAMAFYRFERHQRAEALRPVPGSDWSEAQLQRMRCLGQQHGRLIRREGYGPEPQGERYDARIQAHPPWTMPGADAH